MERLAVFACVCIGLLPIWSCGADAPAPVIAGCVRGADGFELVVNAARPLWERRGASARLVELWRAGGTNEGEALALPIHMAVSQTGWIAIPDWELGEVAVIGPAGEWQGVWTRRGLGPGEVSRPVAAAWREDGSLAIFDVAAHRVVFVWNGERVRDNLPIDPAFTAPVVRSGQLTWAGVQPDGTVYLQPGPQQARTGEFVSLVVRKRPAAAGVDTVARSVLRMTSPTQQLSALPIPGWPRPRADVGGGGLLALAGEDAGYRIRIYDAGGEPLRLICSAADPLPLARTEVDPPSGVGTDDFARALRAALDEASWPETPAPFGRIFIDADGRLWVQRQRPTIFTDEGLLGVPGATYHVFGSGGHFLGTLTAPPGARLQGAYGNTVLAFERGELDETWVVAYRLLLE